MTQDELMITTQELANQRTKMASERTGLATTLGFIQAVFLTTLE